MVIGLITSTEIEINEIIGKLNISKHLTFKDRSFYRLILNKDISVVACVSGIGKVNAAYCTTLLLERFCPDIIYVIGIGGAYPSSGLSIGDIVIAEKEIYGDEGLALKEGFHTMEIIGLPLVIKNESYYYNEFPMHIPEYLHGFQNKGNFVTVSSCTGTLEKALDLEQRFGAICENMEGAAISHICLLYEMPIVEIRGISNIVGDRNAKPLNKKDIMEASNNVQKFFYESVVTYIKNQRQE